MRRSGLHICEDRRMSPKTASSSVVGVFNEVDLPVEFWPPRRVYVGNVIASVLILGCGVAFLVPGLAAVRGGQGAGFWWVVFLGAAIAACALVFLIGCFRIRVRLEAREAVIVGYLRTVHVDRYRITMVSRYPSLRWQDGSGRSHNSLMSALSVSRSYTMTDEGWKRIDYVLAWAKAGSSIYGQETKRKTT